MTRDDAIKCLNEGGSLAQLMLAIGVLRKDRGSKPEDFLAGLRHPPVVREQAAFALYDRTGRRRPADLEDLDTHEGSWRMFLQKRSAALQAVSDGLRTLEELEVNVDLQSVAHSGVAR